MQRISTAKHFGEHIVARENENQICGTDLLAPTLESLQCVRINACRFLASRIYANRETCSRSWRPGKTLQRGVHFSKDKNRIKVLTTHFRGNTRTSRSQTAGLLMPTTCTTKRCDDHTVMILVHSQLGRTHPRAPTLQSPLFMSNQKQNVGQSLW